MTLNIRIRHYTIVIFAVPALLSCLAYLASVGDGGLVSAMTIARAAVILSFSGMLFFGLPVIFILNWLGKLKLRWLLVASILPALLLFLLSEFSNNLHVPSIFVALIGFFSALAASVSFFLLVYLAKPAQLNMR